MPARWSRIPRPLGIFLIWMVLFPAIATLARALDEGFRTLAAWEWALLAAAPIAFWLWLRNFSLLACRNVDACRPERPVPPEK